jgi:hypothetical protein
MSYEFFEGILKLRLNSIILEGIKILDLFIVLINATRVLVYETCLLVYDTRMLIDEFRNFLWSSKLALST